MPAAVVVVVVVILAVVGRCSHEIRVQFLLVFAHTRYYVDRCGRRRQQHHHHQRAAISMPCHLFLILVRVFVRPSVRPAILLCCGCYACEAIVSIDNGRLLACGTRRYCAVQYRPTIIIATYILTSSNSQRVRLRTDAHTTHSQY